jgi:hypothetical protein
VTHAGQAEGHPAGAARAEVTYPGYAFGTRAALREEAGTRDGCPPLRHRSSCGSTFVR